MTTGFASPSGTATNELPATALETRLGQVGAFCDCEDLMNAYHVHPSLLASERYLEDGVEHESDPLPPEPFPSCTGAQSGSTQARKLWLRGGRYGYRPGWT